MWVERGKKPQQTRAPLAAQLMPPSAELLLQLLVLGCHARLFHSVVLEADDEEGCASCWPLEIPADHFVVSGAIAA
jgi:hypothetical protein